MMPILSQFFPFQIKAFREASSIHWRRVMISSGSFSAARIKAKDWSPRNSKMFLKTTDEKDVLTARTMIDPSRAEVGLTNVSSTTSSKLESIEGWDKSNSQNCPS